MKTWKYECGQSHKFKIIESVQNSEGYMFGLWNTESVTLRENKDCKENKDSKDGISGLSSRCAWGKVAWRSKTSAWDKVQNWQPFTCMSCGTRQLCDARELSRKNLNSSQTLLIGEKVPIKCWRDFFLSSRGRQGEEAAPQDPLITQEHSLQVTFSIYYLSIYFCPSFKLKVSIHY